MSITGQANIYHDRPQSVYCNKTTLSTKKSNTQTPYLLSAFNTTEENIMPINKFEINKTKYISRQKLFKNKTASLNSLKSIENSHYNNHSKSVRQSFANLPNSDHSN
jgi:hypothetical protein